MSSVNSNVSSKFWKVSKTAKYLGVSPSQVRLLIESGELSAVRTVGNHRLVEVASILAYCGEEEEGNQEGKIPIALVARVSTEKQGKGFSKGEESDLTRQVEKLRAYAKERWGEKGLVKDYIRIASGMAYNNEVFLRLVSDILAGQFKGGFVIVTHPDRCLRFGISLFSEICKHGDCELVCISESEDKGETESLADDVLAVITHFSAVKHGKRASETCSKNLSPECIKRVQELRGQNLDAMAIQKKIVEEGYLNSHNEPPSYSTIRKYLVKDYAVAMTVEGTNEGATGFALFESFVNSSCVKGGGYRVKNRDLMKAYSKFCQKQKKALPSLPTIGQYISKMGLKRTKSNGSRFTLGIALKG
jgi:excisionase family DNA binding protein